MNLHNYRILNNGNEIGGGGGGGNGEEDSGMEDEFELVEPKRLVAELGKLNVELDVELDVWLNGWFADDWLCWFRWCGWWCDWFVADWNIDISDDDDGI